MNNHLLKKLNWMDNFWQSLTVIARQHKRYTTLNNCTLAEFYTC
jgi:hypothetical protein